MTDQAADQSTPPRPVPGGQHDDPGDLQLGDFGLGGDLRSQLTDALTKVWNADDPGATPDPADPTPPTQTPPSADTAATPAPAPDPSTPASSQGQPGEDGAGGGRAADDGGQGEGAATPPAAVADGATAPAPTAGQPAPTDDFDAAAYFNSYFGTPLNRHQAQELASLIGGLQNLNPQQRAELDRILSGQQPGAYPATMGQPVQPQMQPTVAPQLGQPNGQGVDPAVAVLGPRPEGDDYLAQQWDMAAASHRATAAQIESLQADIARNTQMEQQRQMEMTQQQIDAATQQWRADHPLLSDGEFDALVDRAAKSQTFAGLMHAHRGDVPAATNALLEQHFWSDPQLRERAIANMQSGRTAGDPTQIDPANPVAQQQQQADAGRQALASSVAGGGGSITPQTTSVPKDPQQRKAAMAAAIAEQHDFNA